MEKQPKLQPVHSDVCGPMQTESIGGQKYCVTFTMTFLGAVQYIFGNESQKFLKQFEALVTNKCGQNIATLRTDNGGEYLSTEFKQHLKVKGILHELTIPYTPEQNGLAERMNRTLMESARASIMQVCQTATGQGQ